MEVKVDKGVSRNFNRVGFRFGGQGKRDFRRFGYVSIGKILIGKLVEL